MEQIEYYFKLNGISPLQILKSNNLSLYSEEAFDEDFLNLFKINRKLLFGSKNYKKVAFDLYSTFYKNEFVIKTSFISSKLMNSKAICSEEYPLLDSRIDLISINGKSIAYEIKTKYDNLKRLNKQLFDYSNCFEYVYVICSKNKVNSVISKVPNFVGIYSYSDESSKTIFDIERNAEYSPNINSKSILKSLSDSEISHLFKESDRDKVLQTFSFDKINYKYKSFLKRKYNKKSTLLREESISLIK